MSLTVAYLKRRIGGNVPPVDIAAVTDAAARNGTALADVYRRPFVTVWAALAAGTDWSMAVAAGGARARSAADTDVQLAFRASAREIMDRDSRVVGYMRVPSGNACELCLMASTQRYRTGDLMPIHNHCGCDVEPILGDRDPGHVIDRELLDALKVEDAVAARELVRERLGVEDHGELGPVLTVAGQHFDDLS